MANYFKPKDFLEIIYGSEYSKLDDSYIEKEGGKKIKQKEVNTMLYIMSLLFPDKVIEVLKDRKTTYIDQFIEHCNYLNDTSGVSQTFKYNNRPNLFQNAEMFAQLSDDDILKCLKNINNEKLINNRVSTELDNNWEIILDKFDLYIDKKNKLCKKIGNYERILLLFVSSLTQITYEKKHPKVDLGFERLLKYFAEHDNFENTANVDEYGFIPLANESKTKKDEFIAISFKTDSTNEKDATGNDIVTVLKEKLTERLNIVVGNGGIGKSTLLSKSLKHVLAEKYQIPIMYKSVELKNFSQAVGFYQFITGKGVISEEEKKNIDSFFSAGNKHFVIGLDAIDEMTDRKDAFYNGLKKALREWKNVSFILTTRYTSDLDQLKAYITEVKGNTYTLTGITAANIINYLDKDTNNSKKSRKKFGEEIYYGVSEYMREQLMPVPLFLEKIKQLIDGADSDPLEMLKKVNSTSRLFDMFYEREANEKRGVLESRYVYDFVIPYICFSIKKKTNSEISESELQKQIDYVLREYYADNQSVFKGEVIPATIDAESGIIEAMQSGLTILQVDESKTDDYYFTFSHAIIGSYFSAKFIVNTINIASNKKVTPLINFIKSSGIGDVRWSSEVLDYVNQLLFENAEDGKKAIQNILNAYNGKEMPECLLQNILNLLSFNRNKVYAVSGTTASSAETRKKMSKNATPTDVNNGIIKEYTFKGLDFKGCRINGMKFRGCTFEDCHNIDEDVLSPDGHRGEVAFIVQSKNKECFYSIGKDRKLIEWDTVEKRVIHTHHLSYFPETTLCDKPKGEIDFTVKSIYSKIMSHQREFANDECEKALLAELAQQDADAVDLFDKINKKLRKAIPEDDRVPFEHIIRESSCVKKCYLPNKNVNRAKDMTEVFVIAAGMGLYILDSQTLHIYRSGVVKENQDSEKIKAEFFTINQKTMYLVSQNIIYKIELAINSTMKYFKAENFYSDSYNISCINVRISEEKNKYLVFGNVCGGIKEKPLDDKKQLLIVYSKESLFLVCRLIPIEEGFLAVPPERDRIYKYENKDGIFKKIYSVDIKGKQADATIVNLSRCNEKLLLILSDGVYVKNFSDIDQTDVSKICLGEPIINGEYIDGALLNEHTLVLYSRQKIQIYSVSENTPHLLKEYDKNIDSNITWSADGSKLLFGRRLNARELFHIIDNLSSVDAEYVKGRVVIEKLRKDGIIHRFGFTVFESPKYVFIDEEDDENLLILVSDEYDNNELCVYTLHKDYQEPKILLMYRDYEPIHKRGGIGRVLYAIHNQNKKTVLLTNDHGHVFEYYYKENIMIEIYDHDDYQRTYAYYCSNEVVTISRQSNDIIMFTLQDVNMIPTEKSGELCTSLENNYHFSYKELSDNGSFARLINLYGLDFSDCKFYCKLSSNVEYILKQNGAKLFTE